MLYKDLVDCNSIISDEASIKNALNNILSTDLGSMPGKPNFGCNLRRFLFEPLDQILVDAIRTGITTAIKLWEPRISIDSIEIREFPDFNKIVIDINYYYTFIKTENYLTYTYVLQ